MASSISSSGAPVVAIAGPIGVGKSTVAASLAEGLGMELFLERIGENRYFERFVLEPRSWAFHSQLAFMLGAVADAHDARGSDAGGVLERPVQEMFGVFVRDQASTGALSDDEAQLLSRVVELGERLAGRPDALVVLRASPRVLLERIKARGRSVEGHYDLAYLQRLDVAYDRWLSEWVGAKIVVDTIERDLRDRLEMDALVGEVGQVIR